MASEMNKPVIYVVVNKALNMSPGKVAAQVGHAVAGTMTVSVLVDGRLPRAMWLNHAHRWLIVLGAQNGEQLYHMSEYLRDRQVAAHRVIDEGVNEIAPFSITAVGIGPLDKDSPEATYLKDLPLYQYEFPAQERNKIYTRGWNDAMASLISRQRWYKPWTKVRG